MSDVPDDVVARGVEEIVQGNGEFGRSEVRRQMTTVLGHNFEDALPHLGSQLRQLRPCEPLEISRAINGIQQG